MEEGRQSSKEEWSTRCDTSSGQNNNMLRQLPFSPALKYTHSRPHLHYGPTLNMLTSILVSSPHVPTY